MQFLRKAGSLGQVLIAKYKSDVDAYANPALDAFLADENTGKSFMQMK